MTIDPKILKTVLDARANKANEREIELHSRRLKIYSEIPEIYSIDRQLQLTSVRLAKVCLEKAENISALIENEKSKNLSLQTRKKELLVSHGYDEDYLSIQPDCPLCGDKGFTGSSPCKCLSEQCKKEQAKELCFILNTGENDFSTYNPDFYSDKTDMRYGISPRENMEYVFDKCFEFAQFFGSKPDNLLLTGSPGLGKTFLSGCIAKAVANNGYSVVYDTAIHIVSCLEHEKFGGLGDEGRFQLKRISSCDLLIIDDLGTEMQTAFTVSAIYNILNERIMKGSQTIVNTNIPRDDIASRYNQQIASRLTGSFTVLNFFGDDIRGITAVSRE